MTKFILTLFVLLCFTTTLFSQDHSVLKNKKTQTQVQPDKVITTVRPGYMRVQGYRTIQVPTQTYVPVQIETQVTIRPAPAAPQVRPTPRVMPAPQAMVVPLRPAPTPKPVFRTPIRNGMWYAGVGMNRALWNSRYHRYNRLGRKLNAYPVPLRVPQPNYPY